MGLQELLDALGIKALAADAKDVTFGDPSLMRVEKANDEWMLTSLAAFSTDESLTAAMTGGDVCAIVVRDAKTYLFQHNVNYDAGGCVYEGSARNGSQIALGVTDAGVSAGTVRPRSATEPTNGKLGATPGFHFVDRVLNGVTPYGTQTNIRPVVGRDGVEDRAQTFTARFAVDGSYIVTFDREVAAAPDGGKYGSIQQGATLTYSYLRAVGGTGDVWFGYTGYSTSPMAAPTSNGKFAGWYDAKTDGLVCASEWLCASKATSSICQVVLRLYQTRDMRLWDGVRVLLTRSVA